MKKIIFIFLMFFLLFPFVSAAHFIVGIVNNAADGANANDYEVVLWNPTNGISDNVTDTVGPNGNSGADNIYLMDCEMLNDACNVGDEISAKVVINGSGYISETVNVSVTGAGFDSMPNLTLYSPPIVDSLLVDDSSKSPIEEIDLIPALTREVICEGTAYDSEGEGDIANVSAEFFDNSLSLYGDSNDNNQHYTNNSCLIDTSYGDANEIAFNCSLNVEYYANSGTWNCTIKIEDNASITGYGSNTTYINSLLALSIDSPINFGIVEIPKVSNETIVNVTNAGNTLMNLSLNGYGGLPDDGFAMNCTGDYNITIGNIKYNLTNSVSGEISLEDFENNYINLTSPVSVREFNLDYRKNDTSPYVDDTNASYWRIFVPEEIRGNCSGNVIFGAVQSQAD